MRVGKSLGLSGSLGVFAQFKLTGPHTSTFRRLEAAHHVGERGSERLCPHSTLWGVTRNSEGWRVGGGGCCCCRSFYGLVVAVVVVVVVVVVVAVAAFGVQV